MNSPYVYLSLKYLNMAPCMLRVDKIKKCREMPGGHTEITYEGGRTYLVIQPIEEVRRMIMFSKTEEDLFMELALGGNEVNE